MKAHFSKFLTDGRRMQFTAHSHHPWPDVTYQAHQLAWDDAARSWDDKWDHIFTSVMPEAQAHAARQLGLSDARTIAFASNTHSLLVRILSCLPPSARVLTTDAEFHSASRQFARLQEAGLLVVDRVPSHPLRTFPQRLARSAESATYDLVFFSHVHFDSGYVLPSIREVVSRVPDPRTFIVVDGYHGFMAIPTDLSDVEGRIFYMAGGYKYAMSGEGCSFVHCPPSYAARPVDTGWLAEFGALTDQPGQTVKYPADGSRFLGATFDPTGLYRFNAVQRWLQEMNVSVGEIHGHVRNLQETFLGLIAGDSSPLSHANLVPDQSFTDRGHFLTFDLEEAMALHQLLRQARVSTDFRGSRLRIGFGIYHDLADIQELSRRLDSL